MIEEPFGQGLDDWKEMPIDEKRLREVFQFFDLDNSGSIDKTEFFRELLFSLFCCCLVSGMIRDMTEKCVSCICVLLLYVSYCCNACQFRQGQQRILLTTHISQRFGVCVLGDISNGAGA